MIPQNDLFCQFCGTRITTNELCKECNSPIPVLPIFDAASAVLCGNCSSPNNKIAKFCFFCGQSLNNKKKNHPKRPTSDRYIEISKLIAEYENMHKGEKMKIQDNKIQVGLWGPPGAGKTVYLLSLFIAARQKGNKWNIGFDNEDPQIEDEFIRLVKNFNNGDFPLATNVDSEKPFIYRLEFIPDNPNVTIRPDRKKDLIESFSDFFTKDPIDTKNANSRPSIVISFADVAGENYVNNNRESYLWDHLAKCQGLICLLDPHDKQIDQIEYTVKLTEYLFRKVRSETPNKLIDGLYLPHFVSICFTKMDRNGDRQYMEKPDEIVELLESEIGVNLLKGFRTRFSPARIKLFCISSIGLSAIIDPADDRKITNPNKIFPYNVLAPFDDWIQ